MGEIADEVLDGYRCEFCACVIDGDEPGYTRLCDACAHDIEEDK